MTRSSFITCAASTRMAPFSFLRVKNMSRSIMKPSVVGVGRVAPPILARGGFVSTHLGTR